MLFQLLTKRYFRTDGTYRPMRAAISADAFNKIQFGDGSSHQN